MTKVMTVVGTRPEIIRLSAVIAGSTRTVDHVLVHTGQNYDYDLNEVFFDDLGLRAPDHFLDVDTSLAGPRARRACSIGTEEVLAEERPDAVLVLGDTNSCIAARDGQADADPGLPHGGRQPLLRRERAGGDQPAARRPRRRLQPRLHRARPAQPARRGPAPAAHPAHRLADARGARRTTATQIEAVRRPRPARTSTRGGYFLVSAHREENVDEPDRLQRAARLPDGASRDTFGAAGARLHPPAHPQAARGARARVHLEGITFHEPFGFLDYVQLQRHAPAASCPTAARSARSRPSSASRRSRCATRSSVRRRSTPARSS